ncbi:unnamed protein product [Candidula unifasciata]|uniref:ATP synthase subunit n=1 Tax=Candidula unifasciata TaxID=100452 RepID=A0A8S3Z386_9EUPU|nr:unnamed protein product [Candidula unifasciata]
MAKVVSYATAKANQLAVLARPKLETAWRYSKVELRPPTFSEFPEVGRGIGRLITSPARLTKLTVKEAWLNTLVGAEILFWFYAGECIGKRSVVGYDIPGAVNWELHF